MFHLYKDYLFAVCLRFARNRAEAEDLLQDGFIKIFSDLYQYKPIGSFRGWMRKVVVNIALQHLRKEKRKFPVVDIENVVDQFESNDDLFSRFREEALIKMIQQLPTGYRLVFNLYVIEGYNHKEIGAQLGISESTSRSQLARAKNILRKMLSKTMHATVEQ